MNRLEIRKQIEANITRLPSLPTVVTELMRVINHPNSSAADAERLLANDVSLSSQILKLANSSYYGIPQTIASVRNAVVLLGFNTIKSLILSSGIVRLFPNNNTNINFDKGTFWKHSVEVAIISKKLVKLQRLRLDEDTLFTAGLLHDVGKLVLEELYPKDYPKVLEKISKEQVSWNFAEQEVLDFEHPLVGSILLESWGVPVSVRDPIIFHLDPTESEFDPVATHVLHYADYLSRLRGASCLKGEPGEPPPFLSPTTRDILGLPEDDDEIINLLEEEFQKAAEFFDLLRSDDT